jgi:hypothetical protein
LAAEIVEWIKQNRADTEFFTLMTSTLPTGVYFVPPQKLRDLRVVTDDIWDENWSYEIIEGTNDVYLRISQRQRGGEFKLLFTCISKRILGTAMVPRPESAVWPFIVMLVLDEQFTRIPDQLIKTKPDIVGKFIASTFVVEENLVNRLLKAQKIGAAIVEESFLRRARNAQKSGAELDLKSENLYFYFQIGTAKGRDKLYKLIQGCR